MTIKKSEGLKRSNAIRKPKPKPIPQRRDSYGFEPQIDYEKRIRTVRDEPGSSLKRPRPNPGPRTKPDLFGFEQKAESGPKSKPISAPQTKPDIQTTKQVGQPDLKKPKVSLTRSNAIRRPNRPNPNFIGPKMKNTSIRYPKIRTAGTTNLTPVNFLSASESLDDLHGQKISLYRDHGPPPEKVSRIIQARNIIGKGLKVISDHRFKPINNTIKAIQATKSITQGDKPIPASATRTFNIQAKATNVLSQLFLVSNTIMGAFQEVQSDQKNIQQVLEDEDHFESRIPLETREDPETGMIIKFQKVAEPHKNDPYSIEQFENDFHRTSNLVIIPWAQDFGKHRVSIYMLNKMDADYHWSYMKELPKQGGEGRIIAKAKLYDNEPDYYFVYNEDAIEPKAGELVRYLGIPTLVDNVKKIEWFRYSLQGEKFTNIFNMGMQRLSKNYTGEWNDGNTSKKPLGLTLDQWFAQHGKEVDAYQASIHPEVVGQGENGGPTEEEQLKTAIALLIVYLETVASDPASVYKYLQSITPPLGATVFEKVWAEYNRWRIQRGLFVVSHDNLEKLQPKPVETQSQIRQSNAIEGEAVTPLSSVFGPLYKEQNIRFENQFVH